MNRKMTPWLLLSVLILGAAAWWSQHTRQANAGSNKSKANRVLPVESDALTQVRVRQDYWNNFVLLRRPNGSWDLVEPSSEPANQETVNRLIDTLTSLPALKTLDMPANDSERYRQFGLWSPRLTVTLYTTEREHTLIFGGEADDQSGTYCVVQGKDEVHLTLSDAMQILSAELSAYRQIPGVTNAPARQ